MSLAEIRLDDKYRLATGHLYLTGTQALTRLPMLQKQRDAAHGLNTACFISGYRGSPLGNLDKSLISFSLPTAAEQRWFESLNLPAPSSDVSYSYRRNTARWEITRSQSIISVNVTPLTEVYNVIQSLPPEATGCSLLQWDRLTLLHPTDARAHEETFFSWNATAAGAACTGCASTNLLPITKEVGDRVVVHYCRDCYRCCDEPDQPPIADWPFEPQAFEKNVLPPKPAFRGSLTWD